MTLDHYFKILIAVASTVICTFLIIFLLTLIKDLIVNGL